MRRLEQNERHGRDRRRDQKAEVPAVGFAPLDPQARRDHQEDCGKRVEDQRLRHDQRDEIDRIERVFGDAPELEAERHPLMGDVPLQHRQEDQESDRAAGVEPRADEPAAEAWVERQRQDDAGAEEEVGVLRDQPQPGEHADRQPPLAAPGLHDQRERENRERPEQRRGSVRRSQHAGDREEGRHRRPERTALGRALGRTARGRSRRSPAASRRDWR